MGMFVVNYSALRKNLKDFYDREIDIWKTDLFTKTIC